MVAAGAPAGENNSTVPVTRTNRTSHESGAKVDVLLWTDAFQPVGPLVRDYLMQRVATLREKSTIFHVVVSGTITESQS
jgi:hypothetical protein